MTGRAPQVRLSCYRAPSDDRRSAGGSADERLATILRQSARWSVNRNTLWRLS
jgi:hypothetical protein